MDPTGLREVDYREENGVAWVTLQRPDTLNALSSGMRQELRRIWHALRTDDAVRCVVLSGAGDKSFCTGIDRSEILGDDEAYDPYAYDDLGAEIGPKSNGLWKPVIAAINGMACGGAFYLLGESEFVIAAEHATFFDPHVTYGMAAVYEPIFLSGRMAFGDLMRMSLLGLGERLSAASARESGLVSQVVPADQLHEAARWAAETIAANPSAAVQTTVRSLWAARRLGVPGAIDMGNVLLAAGNDPAMLQAGQDRFRGQSRPESKTR
ncbi:enoyl-CoA hydratase/isomerase family protein [Prescottella equi]|uniref:enoyl-CoA hydratase/isomerase family protein n=1 Tax=Rhodococcus hoagii TaxID=43767 RepID=UPI000D0F1B00|nr:enoyl-CoA hydratase/isomerase family protein [Prescottella equi]AVP71408.1 enoyl-CoA hydratase [Prescottella equi]MCD7052785.1 enoyl-CoA hydratase/isomerase family protein [Rhodococcus sp. BH2-1]